MIRKVPKLQGKASPPLRAEARRLAQSFFYERNHKQEVSLEKKSRNNTFFVGRGRRVKVGLGLGLEVGV